MPVEVADNATRNRYELTVDGDLVGFAEYRDMGATRVFTHTEVFDGHERRGLGTTLVQDAVADVRAQGMRLVALCPFVDAYIREHPDQADLVDPDLDVRLRD